MYNCNIYLLIVFASIPMIAVYNAGAAIFRSMGNSTIAMITSLIMNAVNLGGNAVLIYGCHRGIEGVAIPTLVSRCVAAAIILVLLNNQSRQIHIFHPFSSYRLESFEKDFVYWNPERSGKQYVSAWKNSGTQPGDELWNCFDCSKCGI